MTQCLAKILQLSDLHFGAKGQRTVWEPLAAFIRNSLQPELILITGDIVNTPRTKLFEEAQQKIRNLAAPYPDGKKEPQLFVCPGNHDRFFFGNRFAVPWPLGKHFEYYFNKFEAPRKATVHINNLLRVEVTSIDSTENCRFFARGAISERTLKGLADPIRPSAEPRSGEHDRTLRILLMHHHLLPIPELESDHDGLLGPFMKATTMVANPGKVLQRLSEAKYDIVLHGHEHAFNVAQYASIPEEAFITVIAGPSSTGTETGSSCDIDQSRLNVLEFDEDETLWLRSLRGSSKDQTWRDEGERRLLLRDHELRRAWFARSGGRADSQSGVRWFFELKEDFDVRVLRTVCDMHVPSNCQFPFSVSAVDVEPDQLVAWFVDVEGLAHRIDGLAFNRHPERRNVYSASIALNGLSAGQIVPRFVTQYRWKQAARYTRVRIDALESGDRDFFHSQYMDSVYGRIVSRVAWIEISLLMPLKYAPQNALDGVSAFIQRAVDPKPVKSPSLTRRIVASGDGHYSLRIPYPDVQTKYFLAWYVV